MTSLIFEQPKYRIHGEGMLLSNPEEPRRQTYFVNKYMRLINGTLGELDILINTYTRQMLFINETQDFYGESDVDMIFINKEMMDEFPINFTMQAREYIDLYDPSTEMVIYIHDLTLRPPFTCIVKLPWYVKQLCGPWD